MTRVAVIGAGLSGLVCAQHLQRAGCDVHVFEKSRGVGGRLATRRIGDVTFDHGAQYFTIRDPAFKLICSEWQDRGLIARWDPRILQLTRDKGQWIRSPARVDERWVGTPTMTAPAKFIATSLSTIHLQTRVLKLLFTSKYWNLVTDQGEKKDFDKVVLALPPAQADALFPNDTLRIPLAPCWALMLETSAKFDFDAAFIGGDAAIAWTACDSSKPGRQITGDQERWVIHASPAWSEKHLEASADAVASLLDAELMEIFEQKMATVHPPHRWRYALPTAPLADRSLQLGESIWACGDWCGGPRVEGAFLSGLDVARRVVANLS